VRNHIILNSNAYRLARQDLLPRGGRNWKISTRPGQQGDPSVQQVAEWSVSGPNLNSFEDLDRGVLSVDYSSGVDTRWKDLAILAPAMTAITAPAATYTRTPAHAASLTGALNASALYLYVLSGREPYKIKLSTATAYDTSIDLAENGTCLLATKADGGTEELSIGMAATAYHVVTAVGTDGAADTASANNEGKLAEFLGEAPDREIALSGKSIHGNVLSGTVTMDASAWASIGTVPQNPTPTGFAMDGDELCLGYNYGPVMLDNRTETFFRLMPELGRSSQNGHAMTTWYPVGVLIPTVRSLRYLHNRTGESCGPETFQTNTSPVQGYCQALAGTDRWLFASFYDEAGADSYLCAARPRQAGDPHTNPLSWYVLYQDLDVQSRFIVDVDTANGALTSPTVYYGVGNNVAWFVRGRYPREIDDGLYRFPTASKTLYLTELRRQPSMVKDLQAVEFLSAGCAAARTLTVGFAMDGGAANTLTGSLDHTSGATLNGVVNTNGSQRILFVDDSSVPLSWATGIRIKPQVAFITSDATISPQIIGRFRLTYQLRALLQKVYEFVVVLDEGHPAKTAEEMQDQLLTDWGAGPLAVEDPDGDSYYVKVESVQVQEVQETGGAPDRVPGFVRLATVTASKYPTADGD